MSERITATIDGNRFETFSSVKIARALDSIDTVELVRPFDHREKSQREIFRPLSWKPATVAVGDELILTGTMAPVVPEDTEDSNIVALGLYSKPGVLSECPPDVSSYPLEMRDLTLHEIAARLCEPFDITVKTDRNILGRFDLNKAFPKVKISPTSPILPELAKLSKERGQLIANTNVGELHFHTVVENESPVAELEKHMPPVLGVRPSVKPSEYFSSVTGTKPIRPKSKRTAQFTVHTPYIGNVFRPFIFDVKSSLDVDIETAVKAKLSRMVGSAVSYDVELATWRDQYGALWKPNTMVQLHAPGSMIYKPTIFLIRSAILVQVGDSETASIQVTLPQSFASEGKAGKFPWDE